MPHSLDKATAYIMDDSYPDSFCSIGSSDCQGPNSLSPSLETYQPDHSPRPCPAAETIRNVASQVQSCIESTSMQLRNDYKHRAAVQAWPFRPSSPRGSMGSLGSLWGTGQQSGLLQPQEGSQASLPAAGSFTDYFASRKRGSASNLDRPSPMPFIQALVQDVRASREAADGRPVSPLMLKRLLDTRSNTPVLLDKLRQQGMQQEGSAQQYNISTSPPYRSRGSCDTQNSAGSPMSYSVAAGMPGVLSAGRGSSSVGELSLWGEPLNVSPISPRRSAAALGSPTAMSSRAEGSFLSLQQQRRPQSPTVLSVLATDHNIAPPVVLSAAAEGCGSDGLPCTVAHLRSGSPEQRASCRTRSCSPTAYRSDNSLQQAGTAGRSRSCSPHATHLICCGCRRQHCLQQHSRCCHLCSSCCRGRGTCGGISSCGGSSIGGSGRVGPVPANAGASVGGAPGIITAEASGVSSTSTCPCIKAYRKGQRDAVNQADGHTAPGAALGAAATLLETRAMQHQRQQGMQQLQGDSSNAAAAESSSGRLTAYPTATAEGATVAGQYSNAGSKAGAAAAGAAGQGQDDLVQTAFLEVFAAQQNLMSQGPAADPQDIEELAQILQQVLPAAESQHEQLLKDVMNRQQQLLAMQETFLQEAEEVAQWSAQAPPLRLPSGLGKGKSAAASPASPAMGQEQQQAGGSGYEGFSTRTNSTTSNVTNSTAAARSAAFVTQQDLQGYMSQEDRLATAAAAYEAASSGQKPLQQVLEASRGTVGSRSSRGRFASGTSTVDTHTGHPVHAAVRRQQLSPRGQHQEYRTQHTGSDYEGDAAPAYTADSSDHDCDDGSRPLVHYMTAQGSGSRHVVQEAPNQVHDRQPGFDRASSSMAAIATAGRAPSSRSIADSAWSVQATPPASSNGTQQVQCSKVMHAATEPDTWVSTVGFTSAAAAGPSAQQGAGSSMQQQRRPASSVMEQVSAVVPPLTLGAALDTESARLAGIAVDPRVMGLSPRLRDVDSALSLQELAAVISGNGAERTSSCGRSTDAGSVQSFPNNSQPFTGKAASPRAPGRHLGLAAAGSPAAAGEMGALGSMNERTTDTGSILSNRSTVRFHQGASQQCPSSASLSSIAVGNIQQQQWSPMRAQQQEFKRTASTRAGSFELPESNPTSQENSLRSLEELHEQADRARAQQQAGAAAAANAAPKGAPAAPAAARAAGPQQSLTGSQQGSVVQQRPQEMLSPRAVSLHNQLQQQLHQQTIQQLQHSSSNLSSASSLLDLAARARVLASGGGSRHSGVPMSPLSPKLLSPFSPSSRLQSPRAGLAAAAAAAAAAASAGPAHSGRNAGETALKSASAVQSPRASAVVQQPAAAVGGAGAAAPAAAGGSPSNAPQQQQQTQQLQAGGASTASLSKVDGTASWRDRQLVMQQELVAQQQQLARIRSRASSVATTPAGASMLRSMSRNSDFSTIASSMAGGSTPRQALQPQQHSPLQQQHGSSQQQQHGSSQQQQQQQQQLLQEEKQPAAGSKSSQQQGNGSAVQAESSSGSAEDGLIGILDAALCDTLQQRREARLQKCALQTWKQYAAARKARAASKHANPEASQSPPIGCSPQKQHTQPEDPQSLGQQSPSRPGSGQALRISLQGLNRAMLKQSLGQLLQGQLDASKADSAPSDSLEILVSGQLRLSSPPRQRTPSPGRRPQSASAGGGNVSRGSSGGGSSGSESIRRFEEQLEATRAAVAAAAATAGRAPLQGVLRDMHGMIARMEAVCANSWQDGAAAASAAAAAAAVSMSPQKQSLRQQPVHYMSPTTASAGHSRSPVAHMTPKRQGSAASAGDWHQHQHQHQHQQQPAAAPGGMRCSQAFNRSCSPRRPPVPAGVLQSGKVRSPDRHKLRGRLRQVQDRLAKLEIKMNQASAMSDPCSCNAAGCVHRLNSPHATWAYTDQEYAAGASCCCSLQGKRDMLVGRMQQELEDLQLELSNLHNMMPGAYSSSSGC